MRIVLLVLAIAWVLASPADARYLHISKREALHAARAYVHKQVRLGRWDGGRVVGCKRSRHHFNCKHVEHFDDSAISDLIFDLTVWKNRTGIHVY